MGGKLDYRITFGFFAVAIIVLLIGWVSYGNISNVITSSKLVTHTYQVMETAESLNAALPSLETYVRGFVVSGEDSHLQAYNDCVDSIDDKISKLESLASDNPKQLKKIAYLNELIHQKINFDRNMMDLKKKGQYIESTRYMRLKYDLEMGSKTQDQIKSILSTELTLLDERSQIANMHATGAKITILIASALIFIILASILFILNSQVKQREKAQQELLTQFARIKDIYNNSPCGYHSLNDDGIFVEINETELNWLGYTRDEVISKMHFTNVVTEESKKEFSKTFPTFKKKGYMKEKEFEFISKDGVKFPVLISALAVNNPDGSYKESRAIIFDIRARKQMEKKIKDLLAEQSANLVKLEAANKELESFSYSVSHDLRAPLRHINGYVELFQKKCASQLDDTGTKYLRVIAEASRTMSQLIDELLLFSRMSRNEMIKTKVDLNALITEVIAECTQDIPTQSVTWKVQTLPEVIADRGMLRLALVNLISNALKYSRKKDQSIIEIGSQAENGETCFYVKDNGVGFDMTYADKLFGVFQRLHPVSEFEGTGIGLANVHRIISRHGGRVWAHSELEHGAAFYFSLSHSTGA